MKYPLRRTCQQAVASMLAAEDRELSMLERGAVRLHLLVCRACPRFQRQVVLMRQAMGQWRHYTDRDSGAP